MAQDLVVLATSTPTATPSRTRRRHFLYIWRWWHRRGDAITPCSMWTDVHSTAPCSTALSSCSSDLPATELPGRTMSPTVEPKVAVPPAYTQTSGVEKEVAG